MNKSKLIVLGLISISILTLGGCSNKDVKHKSSKPSISKVDEKPTTYNIESLLKEHPIKFDGFNKNNFVYFDSNIFTIDEIQGNADNVISSSGKDSVYSTKLSNGDKINVKINPKYNPTNSYLKGSDSKDILVSNLKDPNNVNNDFSFNNLIDLIKGYLPKVGEPLQDSYDDNFKVSSVDVIDTYFVNGSLSDSIYTEDSQLSSSERYKPTFSLATIYKVVERSSDAGVGYVDKVSYYTASYTGLYLSNGTFYDPTKSSGGDTRPDLKGYDTFDEALNSLKVEHDGVSTDLVKINK